MRILVVGAGALGQVFGLWLAESGAQVTYLVRPGRERWADGGAKVIRLRHWRRPVTTRLQPYDVITKAVDREWDMVWLCVDSTALRGDWITGLRDAVGAATVITIGQAPHDLATLTEIWPAEQIVRVTPNLLAHQTPGVAYWLPPGSAIGVSGEEERARQVIIALRRGGVRARRQRRASAADVTAARMIPYIAALESTGWSHPDAKLAAAASREALAVAAALHGMRAPLAAPAWAARLALRVLPPLVPFDLHQYLATHFTKVSGQTRLMLDGWITEGSAHGLPTTRLTELRRRLPARMPA